MNVYLTKLLSDKNDQQIKALHSFTKAAIKVFNFPELEKDETRKAIWGAIFSLANSTKDVSVLKDCFIAIRILSREKACLNDIVTNEWLELIKKHSQLSQSNYQFDKKNLQLAIEVLKCLCNLVFNSVTIAKECCQNGILEELLKRIKSFSRLRIPTEITYFDVKLLFLLTALRSEIRNNVRVEMSGVTVLVQLLESASKPKDRNILNEQNVDLICEILKALFNLTLNCYGNTTDEDENKQCIFLVNILYGLLTMTIDNNDKNSAVKNNIINLFTNIPEIYYDQLIPPIDLTKNGSNKLQYEEHDMSAIYQILLFLKELLNQEKGVTQLYEILTPTLSVLLKFSTNERLIRKYLRQQILPPLTDVYTRPEQGNSLRNQLCKLLTTPITQVRDIVAEFLFVLCKKNVKRMIKYTGYGNAAGLFAQRGLLGGRPHREQADFSSDSDSETEEYAQFKHEINPVIGCYEKPHANPLANMTEEEKEYEAMKLVKLMDDLTKCGTIQPCQIGADGKPHPIQHVLQLQEGLKMQQVHTESDTESL